MTSKPKGFAKIWREIKRPFRKMLVGDTVVPDEEKQNGGGKLPQLLRKIHNLEEVLLIGVLMGLSKLSGETMLRCDGIIHELLFWDRCFSGYYNATFPGFYNDAISRLRPDSEVTGAHLDILDELSRYFSAPDIAILDVGAGPLTVINKLYKGVRLNITATDMLAEYYDSLLQKHGMEPPIRTKFCKGEEISTCFPKESFHWINAQNTIDHMEFPVECIKGMLPLLKPGGIVSLFHAVNEGEGENYSGFHQWNFYADGSDFCIAGRNGKNFTNMSKMLLPNYSMEVKVTHARLGNRDRDQINVIIRHVTDVSCTEQI